MRTPRVHLFLCTAIAVGATLDAQPVGATPFAAEVVSYVPGSNVAPGYDDPTTALGSPERSTGSGTFDGDVTPFNTPYASDDVVSLGAGGSLVVRFDHPVTDDVANPFGIDLLIFGNAFFGIDFGSGVADGVLFSEPARIALSQDGSSWFELDGVFADSLFPTLAYSDPPGPFSSGGTLPTSFTRPVDPSLVPADFSGLDVAGIAARYAGSGGGTGVDLAPTGLAWIQYVRISQASGDGWSAEIDALADVPEPSVALLLATALIVACAALRRASGSVASRSRG